MKTQLNLQHKRVHPNSGFEPSPEDPTSNAREEEDVDEEENKEDSKEAQEENQEAKESEEEERDSAQEVEVQVQLEPLNPMSMF